MNQDRTIFREFFTILDSSQEFVYFKEAIGTLNIVRKSHNFPLNLHSCEFRSIEIVPRSCCGPGWVLCLLNRIDLGLTALWHAATCPTIPWSAASSTVQGFCDDRISWNSCSTICAS